MRTGEGTGGGWVRCSPSRFLAGACQEAQVGDAGLPGTPAAPRRSHGGRLAAERGGQTAERRHFWLSPALQVHCARAAPSAVDQFDRSRHLPLCRAMSST